MNNKIHINNLKRAAGAQAKETYSRYEYIIKSDDLTRAFLESKADLKYALKKERTRDRYVANKKGLENAINDSVVNGMMAAADELADFTALEVVNAINGLLGTQIKGAKNSNSFEVMFGKKLGKALGELPFDLLDTFFDNDSNDE
jgi:hypothetical protein